MDIVCIQETHNNKDNEIELGNYKVYFPKAEGKGKNENENGIGGVAIMIRGDLINSIISVERISNRSMTIIMNTGSKNKIK